MTPLDLTVAAVDPADRAAVAESREVVLRGFFEGPDDPPTWLTDVLEILTAAEGATVWLARCGVPGVDLHLPAVAVGGAVLLVHDCLALFAGDATLPGFRRKGVQTSLIRARLAAAARLGCDLAVACTQPGSGSERNYERQGFRLVYARILLTRPLPASPG